MLTFIYVGAAKLLAEAPIWLTSEIANFFFISILFMIRDKCEKISYNISLSSQQGDLALIGVVLIAQTIIQRDPSINFVLLNTNYLQASLAAVFVIIAILNQTLIMSKNKMKFGTEADTYHNIIIVPALLFLLTVSIPVILLSGTLFEIEALIFCLAVWVTGLIYDIVDGRLDQPKWLMERRGIDVRRDMWNHTISRSL